MKTNKLKTAVIVLAAAALLTLIASPTAQAGRSDGGFCIGATYTDGGQKATAGAPGCKTAASTPVVTPAPETFKLWSRMSVTLSGGTAETKGQAMKVKLIDAESGKVYSDVNSGTGSNGYVNFNLGADYQSTGKIAHRPLLVQVTFLGKTQEIRLDPSQGRTYANGLAMEYSTVSITRAGLVHVTEGDDLPW